MNHPPGTILHFKRFQFEELATAERPAEKNKFFIVLHNMAGRMVLACLPTSKDQIPAAVEQEHGCLEFPSGNFTAYVFEALAPITVSGWFFSLRTYVYGYQVREYSYATLEGNHAAPGFEVTVKGRLKEEEFTSMLGCLLRSIDLKRRMREFLRAAAYDVADDHGRVSEPARRYGTGA
jgi:hypothetical protein